MLYEDVFKKLEQKEVRYLVAGGMAVILYGVPRTTGDIDLMIALDKDNIIKFVEAMDELGFKCKIPIKLSEFADEKKRQEWIKEKGMKVFAFYREKGESLANEVDVFVENTIDFEKAFKNKTVVFAKGTAVPLVSIDDLMTLKKLASREQDLSDLKSLMKLKEL